MGALLFELRCAARALVRSPGFTAAALLTFALGIGANTAVFSFVQAILLRPLPFAQPERLVVLYETHRDKDRGMRTAAPRNLEDWRRMSRTIEEFGAWRDWRFTLKTDEGSEGVPAGIASPELFRALRVEVAVGRTFYPDEDRPGRNRVVLLSHAYWQRRFGGDAKIVGSTLRLDDALFSVVGVLPESFDSPSLGWIGVWAPQSVDPDLAVEGRWLRNRQVWARLRDGVTLEQARTEMATIAVQLEKEHADNRGWTVEVQPLHDAEVGSARPALLVFLGAVGFVLLIACVNVANLLLARGVTRQKETAIRLALGAGRMPLVRLFLAESVLLAVVGGAAGVLLAMWALDVFVALSPQGLPRLEQVHLDSGVLIFAMLLSLFTGVLCGLVPLVQSFRVNLSDALKEGGRSGPGRAGLRLRTVLVVSEIALAFVLLVGAGLLTRTFVNLQRMRLGFDPENVLTLQLFPGTTKYPEARHIRAFYQRVTEELKAIPGVKSVGATSAGPLFGGRETIEFAVVGQPEPPSGQFPVARYHNISPGYFQTLGVPLLRGRDFNERDTDAAPKVVIINKMMAERFWPGGSPLGQRIRLAESGDTYEIVGVVGDVQRLRMDARVEPEIYWTYLQNVRWASYFLLRTDSDPAKLISIVRSRLAALDPDQIVSSISIVDTLIARSLRAPRFNMLLVVCFAGVAVLLAAVGIYGVLAYAVTQRTHEIGVRMALGARRRDIFGLVLRQGMRLAALGVVLGAIGGLLVTQGLRALLFGVGAGDATTFAGVALLLAAVTLLACYVPARRAMRVEPVIALRYE